MANTVIQLKRSIATQTPSSLANGEIAYSGNNLSQQLFIGNPNGGAVTPIGGQKFAFLQNATTGNATHAVVEGGTWTANAVVITNANGFVDAVKTNGLTVGADGETLTIASINATANSTALGGNSNTELMTSWAIKTYVDNSVTSGISGAVLDDLDDVAISSAANNNILVYDNDSGNWENHTISGTTSQVNVAFSGQNITIGLPTDIEVDGSIKAGANNLFANSSQIKLGSQVSLGGDVIPSTNNSYDLGSSTNYFNTLYVSNIIGDLESESITTGDITISGSANIGSALTDLVNIVGALNTALIPSGNNTIDIGTTEKQYANLYAREIFGNNITLDNSAVVGNITVSNNSISVGNATVNTVITNASINTDGTLDVAANSTLAQVNATSVNVSSNVHVVTKVAVGNSTVNSTITGTSVDIDGTLAAGNTTITGSTYTDTLIVDANSLQVNSSSVFVGSTLNVNGAIIPAQNNAINLGSADYRFNTLYLAGSTIVIGNTTLSDDNGSLKANNITAVETLNIQGNTVLGSDSSDVIHFNALANSDLIPVSNNSINLGSAALSFANVYTNNAIMISGYVTGNLTVDGDLTVSGNLTSIDVESIRVEDPLIHLAGNNETSDTLDIGFLGHYSDDGGTTKRHTGIFRDATNKQYYVFDNYVDAQLDANTAYNTVDTSNNTFRIATLNAYLESGALSSNATVLDITANSSIAVSITANTLSLTTALPVTSGGTGRTSFTNNAVLFGDGSYGLQTASGTDGQVLQIIQNTPAFGGLDGGTF